ncbi:MAG: DUF4062 domain-containing protein [Actinomycetota bacterium]
MTEISLEPSRSRVIRTPDQRLRVFVSSTLREMASERAFAQEAITEIRLTPVMFELGARPHAPKALYRSYLAQSDIFIGIYGANYGWVAPEMDISGLEDEYLLAAEKPKLIYVKNVPEREPRLEALLDRIRDDDGASYREFDDAAELRSLVTDDLAVLLTERFTEAAAAPAPQAHPAAVSNLPVPVNVFVGRDKELNHLYRMMHEEDARLISVVGPGGIGKTRLALEFARSVQHLFDDGAFLITLQTLQDPALVGAAIARTLRIQEIPGTTIEEVLADELSEKSMVLVIDNFEQVIDAAPLLAGLVADCPHIYVIVTSRAPLNVRAEHELLLPPLEAPDEEHPDKLRRLDQYGAVQLFIDRAQSANPSFHVTDENAPAVAEICHRLDGIPLAIELAAARVRMLTPQAMLERLGDRFTLLRGGARDLPERHQTLRSTIDWSYDLLSDEGKILFRRLGVFNGGWTLDAAESVCNPDGGLDVLDLTATLVEQSLVYTLRGRDEPRFTMLETIRQYARDRAEEADELRAMRDRRSDYFLAMIDAARSRLRSGDQERVLNQLEDDAGNLRSIMRWCLASGRASDAADAAWTLWHYWWLRDRFEEGWRITAEILEHEELTDVERARAITSRSAMAFWRGDYVETLNLVTPTIEEFRRLGDIEGIALCQLSLAIIGGILVGPEEAVTRFDEAREIFTKLGDRWGYLLANNAEGWLRLGLRMEFDPKAYEDTLELAREVGTDIETAMASGNLGAVRIRQIRLDVARPLLKASLESLARYRIRHMATFTMDQIGELAMVEENAIASARLLGAAEAIRERTGAPLPPVQGMYREHTLERGIELAGEDAFNEALAAGADLTFEEAVAESIAYLEGR